jgi:hypothetical protein
MDDQWMRGKSALLDAETDACQEAEPRPREEAGPQMRCAGEMGQDPGHFLPCKHDGHPLRWLGLFESVQLRARLFEDMTREEEESLQRDMGRRSRYRSLHGQMDEKGADCWRPHVHRVALVMEEDTALSPLYRRLFRSAVQVCEAEDMSHVVESLCCGLQTLSSPTIGSLVPGACGSMRRVLSPDAVPATRGEPRKVR